MRRVLAIGAHFDDVELGCGGAVAGHAAAGDAVAILTATRSGYAAPSGAVIREDATALAEGREAARILGAGELIPLGFETNGLTFCDALVCALLSEIERLRPDVIYTHWAGDVHVDHQVLGRATLSAARRVPRVLTYRSNFYDGGEVFRPTHYVDVSSVFERKMLAIRAHASEFRRAGAVWEDFVRNDNRNNGHKVGVEYAEAFQAVRYLV